MAVNTVEVLGHNIGAAALILPVGPACVIEIVAVPVMSLPNELSAEQFASLKAVTE